jgi:NADH-ubiquinone oxidoreductase chain 5
LNDERWIILKGILGLVFIRIIGGRILRWLIFITPYIICLPYYLKYITLFVCIVGGLTGYIISNVSLFINNKSLNNYYIRIFVGSIWFIPYISTYGIINYRLKIGINVVKNFDQGWSEFIGRQNLYKQLIINSQSLNFLQNNSLKIYLIIFILWFIILVIFLIII